MSKNEGITLVDIKVMRDVFGSNDTALFNYLERFIILTANTLNNIRQAIDENNQKMMTFHLHQMKGPVGTIGFNRMYQLCEETEERVNESDWIGAQDRLQGMEKLLQALRIEITTNDVR